MKSSLPGDPLVRCSSERRNDAATRQPLSEQEIRDTYFGVTWSSEDSIPYRMRLALDFLRSISVNRFLDIGCGDGNFTSLVKKVLDQAEVYGTDISPQAVKLTAEKGIPAFCVDLSRENLPFSENYFDVIFAGEVIEHVFDTDHFLDEVFRVLKPMGYLILTTPNLASLYNRIALLLGYEPFTNNPSLRVSIGHLAKFEGDHGIVPAGDHIRVMTLRSLKELLKAHSFSITKIEGDEAVFQANSKLLKLVKAFDSVIRWTPRLSFRVVVFAQKTFPGAIT